MAIAFDNASNFAGPASPATIAFTTAGTDRVLFVGVQVAAAGSISAIAYNGVALTKIAERTSANISATLQIWALANPASGANNLTITFTGAILVRIVSYTGAPGVVFKETGFDDQASATALAVTVTTTLDNCWVVGAFRNNLDNAAAAGAGTTLRAIDGAQSFIMGDSNAVVHPAGSKTLNYTWTGLTTAAGVAVAFGVPIAQGRMFLVFGA